jgi:LuxR family maltose regulon positive regulatory protein
MGYQGDLDRLVAWSLYEQHALALRARHGTPPAELRNRLEGLAERYRDQPGCAWSEIRLASLLARADLAFEHTSESCVAQIEAADIACRALGRQLLSVRLSFMRAVISLRSGDSEQALVAGKDAVRIANEAGMVRVIADLGVAARPLLMLLAQIGWVEPEHQYVEAALRSINAGLESSAQPVSASPPIRADDAPAPGILSQRECEVVALLSKALSTKSIARVLNLSSGTVKWHLKNIYAKLNAVAREDALAKARTLGIIR